MVEFVSVSPEINQLVLVEKADEIVENVQNGIVVPDSAYQRTIGKIIVPPKDSKQYKVGDYVLYVPNSGGIVRLQGREYIFLYVTEIICKLQVSEKGENKGE